MKKIIASKDQFNALLNEDAIRNNGISTGVKTQTLSQALQLKSTPEALAVFNLKQAFIAHKEQFPIYRDMFIYPSFISEILRFIRKVIAYDIPLSSLPKRNENEKELAGIVETGLSCMKWEEAGNRAAVEKGIKKIINDPEYCLYPHFIEQPYLYEAYQQLCQSVPVITPEEVNPHVSLKHALTSRLEMEAIAQDICRKGKPCNVILTSMENQYPLLQAVFARYNIPYTCESAPVTVHMPAIFASLLRYGISGAVSDLEQACRLNAFGISADLPVLKYLFSHYQQLSSSISFIDEIREDSVLSSSYRLYEDMEQRCMEYLTKIQPYVQALADAEDYRQLISAAYDIMAAHPYLKNSTELQAAMQIREVISYVHPFIVTKEDVIFLADYLESISCQCCYQDSIFCLVTDLSHPVMQQKITYVVSADGSGYPGIPVETGLFDEKYMEAIPAYPSQLKRSDIHLAQLQWIDTSAEEELIISWHTNDYQGREVQLALEIEQKYGKNAMPWQPDRLAPERLSPHVLSKETSEKLFFHEGAIHASISSVENYFRCPYHCFLQHGLGVRKPDYGSLSTSAAGNIQHSVMDRSLKDFHKNYASIDEAQIRSYIDHTFDIMRKVEPAQAEILKMTEERLVTGIQLTLKFLQSFENSTSFIPEESELHFCEEIIEGVTLHGIIDRLDLYGKEFLRVIDFKSTGYSLSDTKIKACVQLQLLTYAIIAEKITGNSAAGAYYCSFRSDTYDVPAMYKEKNEVYDTDFSLEAEEVRMMEERTLKGWTFTDRITELDEDGTHISTLKKQKDFNLVRACMEEIYSIFRSRILSGDISLSPDDQACTFCSFRPVCRYHGEYRTVKSLVFQDVKFDL